MANVCDNCGESVFRSRFIGGRYLGMDCGCLREQRIKSAITAFGELTLEHVHTEDGKPLRITSLRQLQEAEKRYNFASVVANFDAENAEQAPQQKVFSVRDMYREKFTHYKG